MITLSRGENEKLWDKYWEETKKEWFKVEVLQDYSGEDDGPSLRAWMKGNKKTAIEILITKVAKQDWIRDFRNKNFKKTRVHITEWPYSQYLEWEIQHYKYINIPQAGENVYLVDKKEVFDLDIPGGDFVIFDRVRVVRNYYDGTGREYQMDFYDEGDDINGFLKMREELLRRSTKLGVK